MIDFKSSADIWTEIAFFFLLISERLTSDVHIFSALLGNNEEPEM